MELMNNNKYKRKIKRNKHELINLNKSLINY